MTEKQLTEWMQASLNGFQNLSNADTVIGSPIETASGTTVIPVSKISIGFATAGLDTDENTIPIGFGGGSGSGMSLTPIAFLAISPDNDVRLIPIEKSVGTVGKITDLIEKTPDIFGRIKEYLAR